MKTFDIRRFHNLTKLQLPGADLKAKNTFYYDETNNIRKFYIKEQDFNASFDLTFVLGGIVCDNKANEHVDILFEGLNLQKSAKEVKFKHLASGDFVDCMKSRKLRVYLSNLLKSNFYIHLSTVNIFYYSIVDIVDSAIANSEISQQLGLGFSMHLKNDLYRLAKLEKESVIDLFYMFGYPNVKPEDVREFIEALYFLFEDYQDIPDFHLGLTSLRQILRDSEEVNDLPFLGGLEDHILLKDFSEFYLRPLYTFKNSNHIFDNEESIKMRLSEFTLKDGKKIYDSYSFVDSKNDKHLQASDIIVGLFGKFHGFLNTSSFGLIQEWLFRMDEDQIHTLAIIMKLIDKSHNRNIALLHSIASIEERQKFKMIDDYISTHSDQ